jgi:hypothetical protein
MFSVIRWMRTGLGWMFRGLYSLEVGVRGMVTDDSETFRLDNYFQHIISPFSNSVPECVLLHMRRFTGHTRTACPPH